MGLPSLESTYPTKTITLPITKKKVKIRPFLVKEEKTMLLVKEAPDAKGVIEVVMKVLEACCLDSIEVRRLPTTDVEYLFLQIRCISKGEVADLHYKCRAKVEVPQLDGTKIHRECGTPYIHQVDLEKLEPVCGENHTNKIPIEGSDFMLVMKYPTFDSVPEGDVDEQIRKKGAVELVAEMVDCVMDTKSGKIYDETEFNKEQMMEFLGKLSEKNFTKIFDLFLDSMPTLRHEFIFECRVCKATESIKLKGLSDFF